MPHRCAILDDYQNVATKLADWSIPDVEVKVFNEPFADRNAAVAALKGFDIICMAYLVLRSRFVPRAIGGLLAIDGLAYLFYSFANLLAPGFAAQLVPWIQMPALIGEGSLCLWLLVVGLDVERWKERVSAATRVWSTPREALG